MYAMFNNDSTVNNRTGTNGEGRVDGRVDDVGPIRSISCKNLQKKFKLHVAALNVGTMRG